MIDVRELAKRITSPFQSGVIIGRGGRVQAPMRGEEDEASVVNTRIELLQAYSPEFLEDQILSHVAKYGRRRLFSSVEAFLVKKVFPTLLANPPEIRAPDVYAGVEWAIAAMDWESQRVNGVSLGQKAGVTLAMNHKTRRKTMEHVSRFLDPIPVSVWVSGNDTKVDLVLLDEELVPHDEMLVWFPEDFGVELWHDYRKPEHEWEHHALTFHARVKFCPPDWIPEERQEAWSPVVARVRLVQA